MPDASPTDPTVDNLPTSLPYPVTVNFRNSDLGIDESAKASRLNEVGMLATMKSTVPAGTVLFSAVDMKAINATARGLARVVWQRPLDDGIGIETLLDFIELSDDAKGKINKLLSGNVGPTIAATRTNFATEQIGMLPEYQRAPAARMDVHVTSTQRTYFEPAPLRQQAQASRSTRFWQSLGVTAYVIAILIVAAFFPSTRAIELMVWDKFTWSLERMWYWANHIGDVKLYNNTPPGH